MTATIEIMGGLGNQLFQIFALIAYSLETKTPFYFENKQISYGTRRKYYWNTLLLNRLKGFIKQPVKQSQIYQEPFFHYAPIPRIDQNIKNIKNIENINIKLVGYFQSYKYFQDHKEIIFRIIKLKEAQESTRQKSMIYLPNIIFENCVSLHFRVGDYAAIQHCHPLMPIEYYEKALERIITDTSKYEWSILYFCEENDIIYVTEKINYLKQNPRFNKLEFIKGPAELDDWEQLLLISLCEHHIIANSTFSWWGAYFGVSENKLVYCPTKWFGETLKDKKMNDLFPSDWLKN